MDIRHVILATTAWVGLANFGYAAAVEPVGPEVKAVQAFGDTDRICAEWTDGCVICLRETSACSLPGIACQPKTVTCTKALQPPTK